MSKLNATLRWKITKVLDTSPPIHQNNIVFKISPNTGLYSQFSLPPNLYYTPQVLEPTVVYHQVINNLLAKLDISIVDKKFPYKIDIPELNTKVLFNIKIRLYPINILSLTITASGFPPTLDAAKLIDYQKLNQLKPIYYIIQWTIGIVETLNHKNFNPSQSFNSKSVVYLDGVCLPEKFQNHITESISQYVGILIRNYYYNTMNEKIQNDILEKNKNHNVKSSQELLLIDKQGILYAKPMDIMTPKSRKSQFSKIHDLYEIAIVFGEFLSYYSTFRVQNEDLADFFLYVIRPWIEEPEIVFRSSAEHKSMWKLLLSEFELKAMMKSIMKSTTLQIIENKRKCFDQYLIGWWNENDFASLLSKKMKEGKIQEMEKNIFDKAPNTVFMRDQYNIGQAGAVGPKAHVNDMTFNQIWNDNKNDIDLSVLAKELAKLRTELKKEASEPDHDISIGTIASAESSAREGNGPKTFEYLSKTGKWAIDVATKIGVPVATEALKKAIGL